jgi:hypothetical protein
MAHKFQERKVIIAARITTQEIFANYKKFKINMRQVFGDIE